MLERLSPIGLWAYAPAADPTANRLFVHLRTRLHADLQRLYGGEPLRMRHDAGTAVTPALVAMRREAIARSTFLVPILTPEFCASPASCETVRLFLDREAQLNASYPELENRSRIFPLLCADIERSGFADDAVATALVARPFFDLRGFDLRAFDPGREDPVPLPPRLEALCTAVRDLLFVRVELAGERVIAAAAPAPPEGSEDDDATGIPFFPEEPETGVAAYMPREPERRPLATDYAVDDGVADGGANGFAAAPRYPAPLGDIAAGGGFADHFEPPAPLTAGAVRGGAAAPGFAFAAPLTVPVAATPWYRQPLVWIGAATIAAGVTLAVAGDDLAQLRLPGSTAPALRQANTADAALGVIAAIPLDHWVNDPGGRAAATVLRQTTRETIDALAARGEPEAQYVAAIAELQSLGGARASPAGRDRAMALLLRAAGRGMPVAQQQLGALYEGSGRIEEATAMYLQAAASGNDAAIVRLRELGATPG